MKNLTYNRTQVTINGKKHLVGRGLVTGDNLRPFENIALSDIGKKKYVINSNNNFAYLLLNQ